MDELVHLLSETQIAQEAPRKNAEAQLRQHYGNQGFPLGLVHIGAERSLPLGIRQAALLYLKTFTLACWSEQFEDFGGQLFSDESQKAQVRQALLHLAVSDEGERKIKSAASLVVSKIATADFPEQWPDLLPTILNIVNNGSGAPLQGALKVLSELVEDCFGEETFFEVARDLVAAVYNVAMNTQQQPLARALAISVCRSAFDTLEMFMDENRGHVKTFAEVTLSGWVPLFIDLIQTSLPQPPSDEDQVTQGRDVYRGTVALKIQAVKTLMRIRTLFPSTLTPHSLSLFNAVWKELTEVREQYEAMYISDDRQGRLIDADGLAYTLDFLVLEELDFMQACLRAPPVRRQMEQSSDWMSPIMDIAIAYAQITTEEEGLWEIDVNVFLSEETTVTTNYTPRTACGDLVIKLGEWLKDGAVEGLLSVTRGLYSKDTSWKAKEAALYLFNQLLGDFQDVERQIGSEVASGYVDFVKHAMSEESDFLRARGFLVAGGLVRTSGGALQSVATSFFEATLAAINNDPSEVVKVACIRALQYYFTALPRATTLQLQPSIIASLHNFITTQDLGDPQDSDDLLFTILETLRDALMLDAQACLSSGGLDLLFTVASKGAANFQVSMLVTEAFEDITSSISGGGPEAYAQLAAKVLPSLIGAFDVAGMTEENSLANLAADMLSVFTAEGSTPMPPGFVATVMPRLNRLLLGSNEEELLKAATEAVNNILTKDPDQVFNWHDESGKGGLEVVLIIIDRLLNPTVDDHAAAEVGGLAAAVVEKAGSERLGPYLMQLLRAVAVRLSTATHAQFIQSLILVFARLSLISASDVVGFLADTPVGQESGLQVVMAKWLENSIIFAGYEDIRQNVTALVHLYRLHDPRLTSLHVKGDLVPAQDTGRIMTRSRARQNPDQYTQIPAQLKILKVLIEELLDPTSTAGATSAAKNPNGNADGGADRVTIENDGADDDEEDSGDWEDDPGEFLDLGTGMSKAQLMAYGADDGPSARATDDETQAFLVQFFTEESGKEGFVEVYRALTDGEREKVEAACK